MPVAQKLAAGLVFIGVATALLLPGRQTPAVIDAVTRLVSRSFGTVISGKSAA